MPCRPDAPDFDAAPQAFRRAFDDRFRSLESLLSTPDSDCAPCRELLKAPGYSPAAAKASAAVGGASVWWLLLVALAIAGLAAVAYCLYRRYEAPCPKGGLLGTPKPSFVVDIVDGSQAVPKVTSGAHVVVYGAPDWCPHCTKFWETFRAVASQKASDDLAFSTCHMDVVPEETKREYKILALPTTLLFRPDKEPAALVGNHPASKLLSFIEEHS